MDFITSKQTLRDAGKGAKGIVLMPHNPINQDLRIHIKSGKRPTRHECLRMGAPDCRSGTTRPEIHAKLGEGALRRLVSLP
jgi:hypothetical protein